MNEQYHLQKLKLSNDQEVVIQTADWESDRPSLKLVVKSKPDTVYEGSISKEQLKGVAESLSQEFEGFFEKNKNALLTVCPEFTYELNSDCTQFSWSQQAGLVKVIYCSVNLQPSATLQPFDLLAQAADTHAKLKDEAEASKSKAQLYHHNILQLQSDYGEVLQDRERHEEEQIIQFRDILNAKSKLIEELEEQLEQYAETNPTKCDKCQHGSK